MTIDEAARILLNGVTGCRPKIFAEEAGIDYRTAVRYLEGSDASGGNYDKTLDAVYLYVWRRLNAHLLLCNADRAPATPDVVAGHVTVHAAAVEPAGETYIINVSHSQSPEPPTVPAPIIAQSRGISGPNHSRHRRRPKNNWTKIDSGVSKRSVGSAPAE